MKKGGNCFMSQRDYDKALEKFKAAFFNYQESGNLRAKTLLKYAYLTSIISRSRSIVSYEEAKHYEGDMQLQAMIELQIAYEDNDINQINYIWNEKISKKEDDPFIIENLNEILHNIRFNYICAKLKAYKKCKFETLEKELSIDRGYLTSLLFEIVLSEVVKAKINLVKGVIETEDEKSNVSHLNNYKNWIQHLTSQ